MQKNDYLLEKIGVDTAENEPSKVENAAAASAPPGKLAARDLGLSDGGCAAAFGAARQIMQLMATRTHRHDTSLFPRLVLGWIGADLCKSK